MNAKSRFPVVLWLLAVAFCILVIVNTRFSTDMSAFLPRNPSPTQQVLVDQMQNGAASRLIIAAIEGAPSDRLAALSNDVAHRLRSDANFASVNNGGEGDAATTDAERDLVWRNRYLLNPDVTPAKFTTEGLRQALQNDLQLLGSDLSPLVKRSIPADPTGEALGLIGEFAGEARPERRDGVWFSRDGSRALLVLQTRSAGFDITREEAALAALDSAFAAAQGAVAGASGAQLRATGPGIFAVHTKTEMQQDISRLSLVATLLVSAILLFVYRSPRVLVLALVPVASGALAGVAAVSLGFGFVHGITLGFGVTLIGEAVDYAIYLFTQTEPGSSPEATLPRIWPLLQLGVLISVCGFSAMLFSSFTGFAQLGLFSITGLLVAVGVTRWILPKLLPENFATARTASLAGPLAAIRRHAAWLRLVILAAAIAAAALLVLHRGAMWEDDLSSLSPIPAADQKLDQTLRADLGAPDIRYLVLATAADQQQALGASEQLSAALDDLARRGVVAGYDAPSRYLPSAATQHARQAAIPDGDTLRERLKAALADLPFRPDLFEPFLADAAAARTGPLLDHAALQGTGLGLKLDSLLFERQGTWTALLSLRGVSDAAAVASAIAKAQVPGAAFVDLKRESDRLLDVYRGEAVMLALIGSVVILLLLAVALHSPRRVALVVAPLAGAVLVTTAALTIGGHRLSIFNLIGLLLTVAVGSNYCIFFERQGGAEEHRERMVASLVLANLCTVIGFGILSFARLPVLNGIGSTVAIGAFLSLVFSAVVTSRTR